MDEEKCEICGYLIGEVHYDSPRYCKRCIAQMEKLDLSPEKYREYRELKETFSP